MSSGEEVYQRVIGHFTDLVDSIEPGEWSLPTPCEGWTVRDLIEHVIVRDRRLAAGLGGPPDQGALPADADLKADWRRCVSWWADGLSDPQRRAMQWSTPLGELSFADATSGLMTGELTIHAWDLARALGRDETLDPEAVHDALVSMRQHGDALRRPGAMGPQVDAPAAADEQTQLIAFTGRQV